MSKESIQGPLTALRNAGTVCGVCLVRRTEVVVNLFPFSESRMNEVIALIDDIALYLEDKGRRIDQLCFGYDGGNLVIVTDEDYRLIVMHTLADEIDFIAKAARAFLIDFQVGLFAEQLNGENVRLTRTGLVKELPPVVIPGVTPESETPDQPASAEPPRIEVIQKEGQPVPSAEVQGQVTPEEDRPRSILPPPREPRSRD